MFALCAAVLLGIGSAHGGIVLSARYCWLCSVPAVFAVRRRRLGGLLSVLLFGLALGSWRGGIYMQKLAQYQQFFNRNITITATASQDAAYNKYHQLTFDAKDMTVAATGQKLAGKVSLGGFGLNAVFAGDEVQATGKLKPSLGLYQGRMSYAQLTLVAHHNTPVSELRRRFGAGVQSALPEPLASFGMGLLIGQRNTLPAEVSQALLMVGLTHIIAVSGYNLTILLRSADKVSGRRSKRLAALLSLALIGTFLLFAGTSASIVRAAIVSVLSVAAGYYGREFKPLVLILLAAAITGFASPFYVWSDSSWYLSFLAFYGVMILAPLLRSRWKQKWRDSVVLGIALESVCAEVTTLPFVLHTFGQMSFAGLIANVLVAALVPLAMLLTLVAGLAGMLVPAIAGWFAWPARIILTYMLDTATMLSRIPHVFAENIGLPWSGLVALYGLLVAVTVLMWFKRKPKNGTITDIA